MLGKKILFISSDTAGCGWYRTRLIADYLQEEHMWLFPAQQRDGMFHLEDKTILSSDIVVIQRHSHEFFLECIPQLQAMGKKVVYDIDDNLWNVPAISPAHKFFPPASLKLIKKIIQICDYVTVSTKPLQDYMLRGNFNKNVVIVPNMLNSMYPYTHQYREIINPKLKIGYAGSPTHKGDFSFKLLEALKCVKKKYDCELIFLGYNPIVGHEDFYSPGTKVESYLSTLNDLKLDIGIAPIEDSEFNRCKSNLKFLEYSACSIPTIASSVYPYSTSIEHGETGFLVKKDKEWLSYLEQLITDKDLRLSMSRKAYDFVDKNFLYSNAGDLVKTTWEGIINDLY